MEMWTVSIKDQTAHSVQSDLDLHCPQQFLVSSTVRKELKVNSFLSDKILHQSKLKAFADNKMNAMQKLKFVMG